MTHFDDLTLATTVHNNGELCSAMLSSFASTVGRVAEVIVIDDASDFPPILPAVGSPVRVIRHDRALGFCQASDRALREVHTPYALLVDADVLFENGDFAGGFDEFKKNRWAWINFQQTNFDGDPQAGYEEPLMPPWLFAAGNQVFTWWLRRQAAPAPARGERIAPVEVAHSSCTLVDMEAFRAVGGFDAWYWQCQSDVDLSLRLRERGYRVGVDLAYRVRHHGAGGKTGGRARVVDLYRARLHLYETRYPASRYYLRPVLFVRHLAELAWFAVSALVKRDRRLQTRIDLLKGVWHGYN